MSAAFDRCLPPGDRVDAPVPPPMPVALPSAAALELDAIGRALAGGADAYARVLAALEEGDRGAAAAAARRLLAELKPDPAALARRLAATLGSTP
jgi:hypothetical protein